MSVTDLNDYRRARDLAEWPAPVTVDHEYDPECVNRSFYFITSEKSEAVQVIIKSLVAEAESFGNGYGNFIGPHRGRNGRYFAIGEVVVHPDLFDRSNE